MLLVIDTNILVNALRGEQNARTKSQRLLADVYAGKHQICVSTEIMREYKDVLTRRELKLRKTGVIFWLMWVRLHAMFIEPKPSTQEEVEMGDEDDRVFFDTAKCAKAKLITRNYRHYPVHELVTLIDEIY